MYYDPEDACYYEGLPRPALAKKLAAKRAQLEEEQKKNKGFVVKKISAPFLSLRTPKHPRKTPEKVQGFDEAVIYGKYVVEHAPNAETRAEEYFYTLYDPRGGVLYESNNYSSLEYCQRAILRFKTHVLIGEFKIEAINGKYAFVLSRKTYVHAGNPEDSYDDAFKRINKIKSYAHTDIIREQ